MNIFHDSIAKLSLIVFLAVGAACIAAPQDVSAIVPVSESIEQMDIKVYINRDGTLNVLERIIWNFGGAPDKHGIFRNIPLEKVPGGTDRINVSNFLALDERGSPYGILDQSESRKASYRIGDADIIVSGKHVYNLSYLVEHAPGYFEDFTEVYWNAIGTEWPVSIEHATVTVMVPADIPITSIKVYCGKKDQKIECADSEIGGQNGLATPVTFTIRPDSLPFAPGYGLTFAIAFPKGSLSSEPTAAELRMQKLLDKFTNILLILPFLATPLFFRKRIKNYLAWRKYRNSHALVAQYDAHGNTPFEVSVLNKEFYEQKDVAAEIVYLLSEGYLKAEEIEFEAPAEWSKFLDSKQIKKILGVGADQKDVLFTKTDRSPDELPEHTKELYNMIVGKKKTEASEGLYLLISKRLKEHVEKSIQGKGLIQGKIPTTSMWGQLFILLFLAVNPGVFIWILGIVIFDEWGWKLGFAWTLTCILCAFLSLIFRNGGKLALTPSGLAEKRYIDGLRHYIDIAEKEKIVFDADPEHKLEIAEKLLPYAMVFGMEKKWLAYLKEMISTAPLTDESRSYHSAFISSYAANSAFASSLYSGASAYGVSSSSGSSSGSSGGGGGGGGGGSW